MSFYALKSDGCFESTPNTTGPWDPRAQHAGPPSALLVRALEREASRASKLHIARATIEILRPIPVAELRVESELVANGRSVARLRARLTHDGRELARATAVAMRVRAIDVEVPLAEPPPTPDDAEPLVFPFFKTDVGYHTAVDLRIARGTFGKTPTFAWIRPLVPLVEGEATTPAQRVAIAADSGNGVSPILDWSRHGFINPDLSIAWHRPLRGEWVGLDATTDVDPTRGVGLARTVLYDTHGPVGIGAQTLLCDPLG